MPEQLLTYEKGTRQLYGKPYHWHILDGHLFLIPGGVETCGDCTEYNA